MQRQIHTFRAATMEDAMDLVRRELGGDAVVVDSKTVASRRFLPWPLSGQEVEVSAERSANQTNSRLKTATETPVVNRTIRTLAETVSNTAVPQQLLAPIRPLAWEESDDLGKSSGSFVPPKHLVPENQSFSIQSTGNSVDFEANFPDHRKTMESLQAIVAKLERQSRPSRTADIPSELFPHFRTLLQADIDEDVARDLIGKLRQHSTSETINSPSAVTAMLTALVEREMRCAPPIQPKPGHREIVTLVGPTGVGKTTTIAKLAGHFHLRMGVKVGLITVDAYRVGAIEQLQCFADILEIPLHAASNPDELRTAIDQLDDVDLVLIDTAGRSPFDDSKMDELCDLVRVASSDHVLLVLSLAVGVKSLSRIADRFASALPTSLVLTKLDELPGVGGVLSVSREILHPVSYFTTGQDVPDQIEPAHPNRLARLVLGRDQINHETNH